MGCALCIATMTAAKNMRKTTNNECHLVLCKCGRGGMRAFHRKSILDIQEAQAQRASQELSDCATVHSRHGEALASLSCGVVRRHLQVSYGGSQLYALRFSGKVVVAHVFMWVEDWEPSSPRLSTSRFSVSLSVLGYGTLHVCLLRIVISVTATPAPPISQTMISTTAPMMAPADAHISGISKTSGFMLRCSLEREVIERVIIVIE